MIERVMWERGRRIKKIAYGLSDCGVTKIARIIRQLAKWEKYWQEKFDDNLSVVILLKNLKGSSQDFALFLQKNFDGNVKTRKRKLQG